MFCIDQDVDKFLSSGWTLLLYAASYAQPQIMHLLLESGADPNKHKGKKLILFISLLIFLPLVCNYTDGFTPFMALCNSIKGKSEDSLECFKLLVNRHDVNNIVHAKSKQR